MKKNWLIILIFLLNFFSSIYASGKTEIVKVSDDIELIKISNNVYIHVTYISSEQFGRFPSNGLIYTNENEAILFDTPMNVSLTKELVDFVQDSLKIKIIKFIPTHWHADCIGGLEYLNQIEIDSYSNQMTNEIAKIKDLPMTKNSFTDSTTVKVGAQKIFCEYVGPAHSLDNIIMWIPSEKILFAGCMIKSIGSKNLGFTGDGDLKEYPKTIIKLLKKYQDAEIVIPGHGKFGGIELIKHTLKLSENN